jgi:hypothetical protein
LEYGLAGKEDHNGSIYFEIWCGCYGFPQAGILANNLLCGCLEKEGYYKATTTPDIWKHKWRPIQFCLIVDDFGIEYVGIKDFNHLLSVLQRYRQVQTNMAGNKIVVLNIHWDIPSKQVRINMRSYVKDLLLSLNWPMPKKPQLLPFAPTPIVYGQKTQFTLDKDTLASLLPECIKRVQKIIRSLLYYAWAVDNKPLVSLNAISARQAKATIHTGQLVKTLLNYVATYPNNGIVYRASDMVLCAHADAGYLNETWSRSRAEAHIYLLDDYPTPRFNGTVLTIGAIIKFVIASAIKAKLAALFISAWKMVPHQQTLIVMRWPQPCSPIQTDNSTAVGVTNKTIVPKWSKMMDMRLWWLWCWGSQNQFCYYWDAGSKIGLITAPNTILTWTKKPIALHMLVYLRNIPWVLPQWVCPFLFFSSNFISIWELTSSDDHYMCRFPGIPTEE